jgi:hypothetical protein
MATLLPTRLAACLALLLAMALPLAAEAGAKKASAGQVQAVAVPGVGVDIVNPTGKVDSPFIHSSATVTNADSAGDCIARHLAELQLPLPQLPVVCNLVTYVTFSVDGQSMGRDDTAPYSLGGRYNGADGRHTATAQAWRQVQSDFGGPVLLGQDSQEFCLVNCSN